MKGHNNRYAESRLNRVARIALANLPTPLERLNNLNSHFKNVEILIKRDDLTGHCFGGNKERKLEFIMADVLRKKATVTVTVGALQSNHCRMTAAISKRLGLKTELILLKNTRGGEVKKDGNLLLCGLMGARLHLIEVNEAQDKIRDLLNELRKRGESPYFIEGGGYNILGVIAYIYAMKELKEQMAERGLSADYLVLPTGTGTTQAGLILGKVMFGCDIEIIGISVSRSKQRCVEEIKAIIEKTEAYLHLDSRDLGQHICVYDEYIGEGFGLPTKEGMKMLKLLAEREGLIIDPIYNAKAFAGMHNLISRSVLKGKVIYLNTGGLPALFTSNTTKAIRGI